MHIKMIHPVPINIGKFFCVQFNDPEEIIYSAEYFTIEDNSFCSYITDESKNTIIAASILELDTSISIYVSWIAVKKEFRSQGYGTQLIDHLKEKFKSIMLSCWEINTDGQRFYKKNQFKEVSRRDGRIIYQWEQIKQ